ncbi:MAG: hypothetical protein U1F43_23700 [Myxococcota bacterium]
MRAFVIAFVSVLAMASATAQAAPPRPTSRIDALLRAIDVVPASRAELERQVPNAQAELLAVAQDGARDTWSRLRAIAFLSFYPDATTKAALLGLARAAKSDADIRGGAIYSFGRTFGSAGEPAVADVVADVAERDADASVREQAVRALRWVDAPAAAARLTRIGTTRPELAGLAKMTAERRAKRMR